MPLLRYTAGLLIKCRCRCATRYALRVLPLRLPRTRFLVYAGLRCVLSSLRATGYVCCLAGPPRSTPLICDFVARYAFARCTLPRVLDLARSSLRIAVVDHTRVTHTRGLHGLSRLPHARRTHTHAPFAAAVSLCHTLRVTPRVVTFSHLRLRLRTFALRLRAHGYARFSPHLPDLRLPRIAYADRGSPFTFLSFAVTLCTLRRFAGSRGSCRATTYLPRFGWFCPRPVRFCARLYLYGSPPRMPAVRALPGWLHLPQFILPLRPTHIAVPVWCHIRFARLPRGWLPLPTCARALRVTHVGYGSCLWCHAAAVAAVPRLRTLGYRICYGYCLRVAAHTTLCCCRLPFAAHGCTLPRLRFTHYRL